MGKSFIFKDSSGRAAGYLVQGMGRLCCRADMPAAKEVRLCLLYADGSIAQYALDAGGREQMLADSGRAIAGAAILARDAPPLGSDERTLHLILQREAERQRAERKEKEREERETKDTENKVRKPKETENKEAEAAEAERKGTESGKMEEGEAEKETLPTSSFPQRRWPPPPCWPQARYAHGRWQEDAQ